MQVRRLPMIIPLCALVLGTLVLTALLAPARSGTARDIAIVNHAAGPIVELYVSPSSEDSWGDNRLGADSIAPGTARHLAVLAEGACLADVRVVYSDGRTEERRAADLCRMPEIAFDASAASALPKATLAASSPRVVLVNNERRVIVGLYLSSSASDDWGDNHLSRPLAPGGQVSFSAADGCIADLRVVFDNHAAQERRRMDICRDPPLTIRPGWTSSDDRVPPLPAADGSIPDRRT